MAQGRPGHLHEDVLIMKTIVIDARTIDSSTGKYTQALLHHLNASYATSFHFVVVTPPASRQHWQTTYPNLLVEPAHEKSYSVAEQTSFVRRLESYHPDLVHFTMPQQPFLWVKPSVTTIHDLTLVRYDNIDMNRLVYKMKKGIFISLLCTVVARSKAIITPTHYVKNDVLDYMGRRYGKKIHVTLEAGEIINATPTAIDELVGRRFLLFVGNAFPYKNVGRIIEAFALLKQRYPDLHLALAGKKDFFYDQHQDYAARHGLRDVHFLGFISDGEKRWALHHCELYIAASLSEGFDMPTLEVMHEGAPLVASNATCHPEVIGNAGVFFDPHSTDDLVRAVSRVIDSPRLRSSLIRKGHARVRQFSWARMADETVAVYRQVLGE